MKFSVLTLFPELIEAWKKTALVEDALHKNLLSVDTLNLRSYSQDKHKNVDDKVYGGDDGMVLMAEPLALAVEAIRGSTAGAGERPYVVALSPQGKLWHQSDVPRFLAKKNVVLVCGRYAGMDQRFINEFIDEEISIGDYVLNGGEVAALTVMESVSRFIPGFLGHQDSAVKDSLGQGPFLESPLFTRPQVWRDQTVPAFLLNGNHGERDLWLKAIALVQTFAKRPDLVKQWSEQQLQDYQKALSKVRTLSEAELAALGLKL